jgi:hypothetical protein
VIFKSSEVEREFHEDTEAKIVAICLYGDWWARWNFGHELLVTDVSRDQAEYDRIYADVMSEVGSYFVGADGVRHYAGPRPHLRDRARKLKVRATDFGVQHGPLKDRERMTREEAIRLTDHLNAHWPRRDGKKTAMFHDVGSGPHVHVQAEVA